MYDTMCDEVQQSSSLENGNYATVSLSWYTFSDIDREISSIGASRCTTAEIKSRVATATSTTAPPTATGSMFATSINPEMTTYGASTIAGPIASVPSTAKAEEEAPKFDPTKPNDHPILQVCYIDFC